MGKIPQVSVCIIAWHHSVFFFLVQFQYDLSGYTTAF